MSKATELRALRLGRSIDAPINYHHRTGDSENGGNMLDLYAQAESAEDVFFGNADERARELFVKGFRVYLKKVFTEQERQFLERLLAGKESPYKIGQSLGVEWFAYMQSIQRKAYKNVKPLKKLVKLTGWSGAEEFIQTIYERLAQLSAGFELNAIIPQNIRLSKAIACKKAYYAAHREEIKAYIRAYYAAHREEISAQSKAYHVAHREEINARKKAYYAAHREEIKICIKAYREARREEMKTYQKAYRETRREEISAQKKAYHAAHREEISARKKAYRETHREEINARMKAYRAKKKAQGAKNERENEMDVGGVALGMVRDI